VCSNKAARKRLARRHSRNGHMNVVLKGMCLYVGSVFKYVDCCFEMMYLYVDSGLRNWNGYYY